MLNYTQWLRKQGIARALIVQVQVNTGGSLITRYLSTHDVTVDGVSYLAVIKGNISTSSSINLDYNTSISFGDIDIINSARLFDGWLNDNWSNKSCKIYYGEVPAIPTNQSLINDYELIFDGIVDDIDSKSNTVLSLKIRDKLEKVNYPVTEKLLGNYFHGSVLPDTDTSYNNQSRTSNRPLVFGEVNNITPMLTDPTQLEYMVSDGPVELIIEVLDNGVPVSFRTTKTVDEIGDIPPGSFRLDHPPVGTVTASVQGVAKTIDLVNGTFIDSYTNTAANIIATILKFYGRPLDYSEIDTTSFTTLATQPVGVFVSDRTNSFTLCSEIAKSANCVLVVTRQGKVRLVELKIPTTATIIVDDTNIIFNSIKLSQKPNIVAGIKLGYARNWTPMTGIVTGIPEEHKNMLAKDYIEAVAKDPAVQAAYNLTVEPDLLGTFLITSDDANTAAQDRLQLRSNIRKIIGAQGVAELMQLEVGSPVIVNTNRFGIPTNTKGLVVSVNPDWLAGKVDLEILV